MQAAVIDKRELYLRIARRHESQKKAGLNKDNVQGVVFFLSCTN
jgi:hypothetical protein